MAHLGLTIDVEETKESPFSEVERRLFEEEGIKFNEEGYIIRFYHQLIFFFNVRVLVGESILELSIDFSKLQVQGSVGKGASAIVRCCKHKETDVLYAVKMFQIGEKERCSQLVKELKVLSLCDSPYLVRSFGAMRGEDATVNLVMEFMDCGSLAEFIHCKGVGFGETITAAILYQILSGLSYLHDHVI